MEKELQGGVCGGNFWNSSRNLFASSPCSSAVNGGVGSFGWSNHGGVAKTATSISDDSVGSATTDGGGSMALQDVKKPHHLAEYWNQDLLHESGRSQENYSYILQALNSSMNCRTANNLNFHSDSSMNSNQSFPIEQNQPNSFTSLNPVSYNYTSSLLQNLFDEQSLLDYHQMNSTEFLPKVVYPTVKPTLPKQQGGDNFPFINRIGDVHPSFLHSTQRQLIPSSRSRANDKHHNDKVGNESAIKRPRVETPSPLPAFKVRKQKLGDRVTALQQLVSPFGKTDTASVLHEAIEYIKLLHDQVTVLSTPYLKNGSPPLQCQKNADNIKDQEEAMEDLRSRGLCLVPIASTFPVAAETSPDFWTPTFR